MTLGMLYSYDLHSSGDRYSQVHYGLLIRNITQADNGIYTCCAEVQTTGALAQRDIEVIVYCKFVTGFYLCSATLAWVLAVVVCLSLHHMPVLYQNS